jgi:hypothetical protein
MACDDQMRCLKTIEATYILEMDEEERGEWSSVKV